jgi:hypothetical protein
MLSMISSSEYRYGIMIITDRFRIRQYRIRIKKWKLDKKVKPDEMMAIVRRWQQRKLVETDRGTLGFKVRDRPVEAEKILRWMRTYNVPEDELYAPSPSAREFASQILNRTRS